MLAEHTLTYAGAFAEGMPEGHGEMVSLVGEVWLGHWSRGEFAGKDEVGAVWEVSEFPGCDLPDKEPSASPESCAVVALEDGGKAEPGGEIGHLHVPASPTYPGPCILPVRFHTGVAPRALEARPGLPPCRAG